MYFIATYIILTSFLYHPKLRKVTSAKLQENKNFYLKKKKLDKWISYNTMRSTNVEDAKWTLTSSNKYTKKTYIHIIIQDHYCNMTYWTTFVESHRQEKNWINNTWQAALAGSSKMFQTHGGHFKPLMYTISTKLFIRSLQIQIEPFLFPWFILPIWVSIFQWTLSLTRNFASASIT